MSNKIEPLKKFATNVDLRSRKDMVNFLSNHFRYNTMSSWNQSTSYANNVKIHNVIPKEIISKVWELFEVEGFYDDINWILEDWGLENDYSYQAGFNGRSGGYIVMYEGYRKRSEYKSVCLKCGQRNFKKVPDFDLTKDEGKFKKDASNYTPDNRCGKCGENSRINKELYEVGTWPGRSIDMSEDFEDWEMGQLKERVKLVTSFDQMCDDVVATTIAMATEYDVVEEEYQVTKTRKVIKEKE